LLGTVDEDLFELRVLFEQLFEGADLLPLLALPLPPPPPLPPLADFLGGLGGKVW
jgi:hypothetical protein